MSRERLFTLNDPHAMRISAELAAEIGLMESIVLLQFEFLLSITRVERRGKPWIKATLEELRSEHFRWSSRATIWRAIQSLHSNRLLLIDNFNPAGFDKTQWFTLDMKNVSKLSSVRVFQDETAPVFQNETSQVEAPELQLGNSESFQNETGRRESRQDVSDRDVDVSNRALRGDQNETTIERDLRARDLKASPKDASSVGLDHGRQTFEILQLALKAGKKYPNRVRGHLAKEVKKLLEEGFSYHQVLEGTKRWESKGLNPGTLPSFVNEVVNGTSNGNGHHRPFDAASQNYEATEIR